MNQDKDAAHMHALKNSHNKLRARVRLVSTSPNAVDWYTYTYVCLKEWKEGCIQTGVHDVAYLKQLRGGCALQRVDLEGFPQEVLCVLRTRKVVPNGLVLTELTINAFIMCIVYIVGQWTRSHARARAYVYVYRAP